MHTDYLKSCHGKRRYHSRHKVKQALKMMKRTGKRPAIKLVEPYQCRYCNHWHMGGTANISTDLADIDRMVALADAVRLTL